MSWREEQVETTDRVVDDKWLKIPDAPVGKTSEVKLRILDEEPVGTWRHWHDGRSYNCPGIAVCPVCAARKGHEKEYRIDYRYFFNVYADGKVKVFSFGSGVGRKLKTFAEKYGDLRDYDVSILKRKTGPLPMNVEWDTIFEGKSDLNERLLDGDKVEDLVRYDLSEYVKPATMDVMKAVARGEVPTKGDESAVPPGFERFTTEGGKATKADMIMVKALIEAKGFNLAHFGLVESSPPSKAIIEKLIQELQATADEK